MLDVETGLYFYRARYYHPGLGTFVSRDPIEYNSGDVNLYRYCLNAPGRFADPSGLETKSMDAAEAKDLVERWASGYKSLNKTRGNRSNVFLRVFSLGAEPGM